MILWIPIAIECVYMHLAVKYKFGVATQKKDQKSKLDFRYEHHTSWYVDTPLSFLAMLQEEQPLAYWGGGGEGRRGVNDNHVPSTFLSHDIMNTTPSFQG